MAEFEIGQFFENEYPVKAVSFAAMNDCTISPVAKVERTVDRIESRPDQSTGSFVVFSDGTEKSIVPADIKRFVPGTKHTLTRFQIIKKQQSTPEQLAADVRMKRDTLLAKSDYLMMSDYQLSDEDKALVVAYRQALRDIPEQEGFPTTVQWPVVPNCLN